MMINHATIEKNATLLLALSLGVVTIGGIVEIVPLFYLQNTIEHVEGMRPYTPLELAGPQHLRPRGLLPLPQPDDPPDARRGGALRPLLLAAESMYDHPFQWGSKRTGPDLARVGGRYSDEWHVQHLIDPRSVVPASIMPGYPHLAATDLRTKDIGDDLKANADVGVPYTDEMIANALADLRTQADPNADSSGLLERYGAR